jgi:predicted MFS family arabinose efflux permease
MWDRLKQRPLDLYILYRSLALTWAFMPFQVFFLQARGLSLAAIFDLNVVFSLATVALEVPTGIFADRNGRRVAMALAGVVMAVACGFFLLGGGFWVYALANVLCALSMTLASGADSAWLYDHLHDQHRAAEYARYEGLSTAAKGIGNLVAVLVGGLIYSVAPWGVFAFTGLLTTVAGTIALALPERPHPPREGTAVDDLLRAATIVRRDGRLGSVLTFGALTFVLLRLSLFTDQPHLELHLSGLSASQLALAAALLAAGKEIAGAAVASTSGEILRRFRWRTVVLALVVFLVATYGIMGLGAGVVDIGMMVLLSSAFGLFSPLMRALMNRLIPASRDRATLLSFESMGRRVLFAAASPLFGRAVEASSLHATFTGTAWVAALAYGVLGLVAYGLFRAFAPAGMRPGSALVSFVG